jgi:hypothetical protein
MEQLSNVYLEMDDSQILMCVLPKMCASRGKNFWREHLREQFSLY